MSLCTWLNLFNSRLCGCCSSALWLWTLPHMADIMIVWFFLDAHHNNFCIFYGDVRKSTALQAYFRLFYLIPKWKRQYHWHSITDTVFGGCKKSNNFVSKIQNWYHQVTIADTVFWYQPSLFARVVLIIPNLLHHFRVAGKKRRLVSKHGISNGKLIPFLPPQKTVSVILTFSHRYHFRCH